MYSYDGVVVAVVNHHQLHLHLLEKDHHPDDYDDDVDDEDHNLQVVGRRHLVVTAEVLVVVVDRNHPEMGVEVGVVLDLDKSHLQYHWHDHDHDGYYIHPEREVHCDQSHHALMLVEVLVVVDPRVVMDQNHHHLLVSSMPEHC
jgi:hypothetical protein